MRGWLVCLPEMRNTEGISVISDLMNYSVLVPIQTSPYRSGY
jgi:hypothetical protein